MTRSDELIEVLTDARKAIASLGEDDLGGVGEVDPHTGESVGTLSIRDILLAKIDEALTRSNDEPTEQWTVRNSDQPPNVELWAGDQCIVRAECGEFQKWPVTEVFKIIAEAHDAAINTMRE